MPYSDSSLASLPVPPRIDVAAAVEHHAIDPLQERRDVVDQAR